MCRKGNVIGPSWIALRDRDCRKNTRHLTLCLLAIRPMPRFADHLSPMMSSSDSAARYLKHPVCGRFVRAEILAFGRRKRSRQPFASGGPSSSALAEWNVRGSSRQARVGREAKGFFFNPRVREEDKPHFEHRAAFGIAVPDLIQDAVDMCGRDLKH